MECRSPRRWRAPLVARLGAWAIGGPAGAVALAFMVLFALTLSLANRARKCDPLDWLLIAIAFGFGFVAAPFWGIAGLCGHWLHKQTGTHGLINEGGIHLDTREAIDRRLIPWDAIESVLFVHIPPTELTCFMLSDGSAVEVDFIDRIKLTSSMERRGFIEEECFESKIEHKGRPVFDRLILLRTEPAQP